MSLENPQLEDGFTPIANAIMDALARTRFSGYERSVLDFLFRKTYGWSKKSDLISLSQFVDGTGILKPHVVRTIKRLVEKNVIHRAVTKIGNDSLVQYEFNKHWGTWQELPKMVTTPPALPKMVIEPLPKMVPTISISTQHQKDLKSSPQSKSLDPTNYQGFQDAWTSICVSAGLHGVRDWSTWHERIRGAWNRIAASKDPSWSALSPLERICDLFTHAAKISFLAGDNSRKWKADLEFVLRPLSIDRIMGDYYCDTMQTEPLKLKPAPRTEEQDRLQRERGLAWLDPDNVKEEVKDER